MVWYIKWYLKINVGFYCLANQSNFLLICSFFEVQLFFILYSKIACFKNSIVCTLMETNTLQRTYNLKKKHVLRYIVVFVCLFRATCCFSCQELHKFSESLRFKNLYRQKTAGIACQKDNTFAEFHINLSFGSGCVQS